MTIGREAAGLYVHLPFCVVRCTYCDFYTLVGQDALAAAYTDALVRDIRSFAERTGYRPELGTVYIGGGTPSHLPPGSIPRILEGVLASFAVPSGAEITVEANPESASREILQEFRRAGVNRLSMGAQSFRPRFLEMMGRPHGPHEAARAVERARGAGFDNVGIDLIYGLPGQGRGDWEADLDTAIDLGTEHLSAYLLETDKDTPLSRLLDSGSLDEPDAETIASLFHATEERLSGAGFLRYEVSNWSRPGRESRHNLGYWTDAPCLGFGASAHAYYLGRRRSCRLSASGYVEAVTRGADPTEPLDDGSVDVRVSEAIVTALRLARGADFDAIGERYDRDLWTEHAETIEALVLRGWAVVERPRVRLTLDGILWSMDALSSFVASPRIPLRPLDRVRPA